MQVTSLYPDWSSNKPQVIHICTYGWLDGFPSRAIYPFFRRVDASRQGVSVFLRYYAAVDIGPSVGRDAATVGSAEKPKSSCAKEIPL